MTSLPDKEVLVLGLGVSGVAACELLCRAGARVRAVDTAQTEAHQQTAARLREAGIRVQLGATSLPPGPVDFAVVSPGVPWTNPLMKEIVARQIPLIGELELGFQNARCLNVAITGTNGKTTTTELVERLLTHYRLKTVAAGNIGLPVCAVVAQTPSLDFLTLEVSSFQLETILYFRPAVGVLLNITPDHMDRYPGMDEYARAKGRLFENQQLFDWAVIQLEALARLRALDVKIPAKIVTFSASDHRADIFLDRSLIVSRVERWEGPLLNMEQCRLSGPHNAENLMAALAVGRILRIPLDSMVETLRAYEPAPHRCERVAERGGVLYINDSKATNLDAVHKALLSVASGPEGAPNVWLIAGGKDKGLEYHDIGPILSQRVKGAFLIGETREKIRAAWSLFTPCTLADSLIEAVKQAAHSAVAGDVVLLSPACSSFDQFQNYQHRGEVFRQAVRDLNGAANQRSPGGGASVGLRI